MRRGQWEGGGGGGGGGGEKQRKKQKKNEKDDKEWSSGRNQRRSPESHWSFRPTTMRRLLLLRLPGFLGDFGCVLSSQRALVRWKRSKLSSKRPISAASLVSEKKKKEREKKRKRRRESGGAASNTSPR